MPAAAPRSAGRAARDPPRHTVAASHPSQTVGPIGTRRQLSLKRDGGAWTAGRALLLLALLLLLLALALVRAIARGGGADRRALVVDRAASQSVAPPPPPPPPPDLSVSTIKMKQICFKM